MIDRRMVLLALVLIISAPVLGYSGGNPPGQPFQSIQRQIDELKNQLGDLQDRFTPPTISYESSCEGSLLKIDLNVTDDKEIAYYGIQEQGGNPPTNLIIFVESGLASVNYQFTVDPGSKARMLLFVAADNEGNISKSLFEIEPDVCIDPVCTPGQAQLCPNQTGVCAGELQYCASDGASWLPCDYTQQARYSPIEICWDHLDNNCDGRIDEGCPR